ncbi:hypothetical protein [Myxosarcina sp. GI1]|uniref:hypothetical protein n=1 Tax=Myxosarcina sp. GI1 TaxID=1541065 RepID=UPI00055A5ABD|nr:hypothetical protein [Myxosarcina sp. GI1]
MAVKEDLTFEELNTALGVDAFSLSGSDIVVSVSAITGDTYTALTDEGTIEFLYKLRSACTTAQDTANEGLTAGEQLDSFPGFSYSPPADGYVTVTQSHTVQIPLDTATVKGTNV